MQTEVNGSLSFALPYLPSQRDRFQTAARSSSPFHPGITQEVCSPGQTGRRWSMVAMTRRRL